MDTMRIHMKFVLLLLIVMAVATPSYAIEVEVSLAPAAWSYKETMGSTAGYTVSTPLRSSASGLAAVFELRLQQNLAKNWTVGLTGEALSSLGDRREVWHTPSQEQQNKLKVDHQEVRADILYRWIGLTPVFSLGGWLAWQRDVQRRRGFVVNGVPVSSVVARETIQVSWFGLTAFGVSEDERFRLRLSIGTPLSVKTTNSVIAGTVFNKKKGIRWTIHADYRLFTYGDGESTRLTTSYRFRELGNEIQTRALWPKNQWRVLSLGIQQTW